MKKMLIIALVAAAANLAACNNTANLSEEDFEDFTFQTAETVSASGVSTRLADGEIPSLKVRLAIKSRANALGQREKVASAVLKWSDNATTLTGPVTLAVHNLGETQVLTTKTASITSNTVLDAGIGYTGNAAYADPFVTTASLCVDATWETTTGANGYTFNQTNKVVYCQKQAPTPIADLKVNIDPGITISLLGSGTLKIPVQNSGPAAAANVVVTTTLPADVQFLASTGTTTGFVCATAPIVAGGETVTCSIATLSKGTKTASFTVKGLTAGTYSIPATVSSPTIDPISGNNSRAYSVVVNSALPPTNIADLSAKLTLPTTPAPAVGSNMVYTLNVTNLGPNASVAGRVVTFTRSSSLNFVSATLVGSTCSNAGDVTTCTLPSISSSQSSAITLTVLPTIPSVVGVTAEIAADASDPGSSNNTSSISTTL